MTRIIELTALASIAALAAEPAQAAITVLGGGFAHACYQAAEFKRPLRTGLMNCETALKDEVLSRKDRAATFVNRGIIYMFERDFQNAIADYDAAIKIDGKLAEAFVNKGIAVLHQGGHGGLAIELLSKGLALEPARPEVAFYTRGVANEMAGNAKEAYYDYTQAAALKPDWAEPKKELRRFKVVEK